jgi:tetratricopeptide (TPR) repeat protein
MKETVNQLRKPVFIVLLLCLPSWAYSSAVEALIAQAESLLAEGRYAEASTLLRQAVADDPDSSLAYTRLGGVQLLQQHYRESIKSFQQAISIDQARTEAFIGMAIGYLHLGRYELAKAALHQAEKLDPGKKTEIDKVLSWLAQRSDASTHQPW